MPIVLLSGESLLMHCSRQVSERYARFNMAEVNTESSNDSVAENGSDGEESGPPGSGVSSTLTGMPLLRPSAFNPAPTVNAGGPITASRLAGNPFTSSMNNSANAENKGSGAIAQNPFAAKSYTPHTSDSDDEKKEKPIVAPSHFQPVSSSGMFGGRGAFGSSSVNIAPAKVLLRPSILDKHTVNIKKAENSSGYRSNFRLEPAKLQSPFMKTDDPEDGEEKLEEKENESHLQPVEDVSSSMQAAAPANDDRLSPPPEPKECVASAAASGASAASGEEVCPPVAATSPLISAPSSTSDNGGQFIFGQNMETRVEPVGADASAGAFLFGQNLSDRVTNTPLMKGSDADSTTDGDALSPTQTLAESAAAQQAKQLRPDIPEVEVLTGEEQESNVFQLNAKLFAFDKETQSWLERGRGLLRLNDMSEIDTKLFQSRLVMRTQGSLRLVMNTKIWPGMCVERASQKSIRFSAVDGDEIKIYLVMASPKDADQIFSAIDSRVQQLKTSCEGTLLSQVESQSSDSQVTSSQVEKRPRDTSDDNDVAKKPRMTRTKVSDMASSRCVEQPREESNDSSTVDPETEASNESCTSSPTVKSSSSDA